MDIVVCRWGGKREESEREIPVFCAGYRGRGVGSRLSSISSCLPRLCLLYVEFELVGGGEMLMGYIYICIEQQTNIHTTRR